MEAVGNYALRVQFDDLHSSAIFSWDFLRELGANKFSRMRAYISALRQQGGQRGASAGEKMSHRCCSTTLLQIGLLIVRFHHSPHFVAYRQLPAAVSISGMHPGIHM